MKQILFHLGPIPVTGYGVMVLCGVLSALFLLHRGAQRRGWDAAAAVDLAVWVVLGGILGGRLFYVFQFWGRDYADAGFWEPFKVWQGGLVLYGAIFGGLVATVVLVRRQQWPVLQFLDVTAPGIAIGIAFGRIGCLLNGCCWGQPCAADFRLGIRFPPGSPVGHTDLVHPTQIYAACAAAVLAWVCWRLGAHRPPGGVVFGVLAIFYGVSRFTTETIRGDHKPHPGEWPVSQTISVYTFLFGIALVVWALLSSRRAQMAPEGS